MELWRPVLTNIASLALNQSLRSEVNWLLHVDNASEATIPHIQQPIHFFSAMEGQVPQLLKTLDERQ
jgi:hypothetical protein